MKLLQIKANGLPLFKQELNLTFFPQQRISEQDRETLYDLGDNFSLNTTNAFIGINASGKTSVLKVIHLALGILNSEPINHLESRTILGGTTKALFSICFLDSDDYVYRLRTEISSRKTKNCDNSYFIVSEMMWKKPLSSVKKLKKSLTDFRGCAPVGIRNSEGIFIPRNPEKIYLPEDVSFIIAYNRKLKDEVNVFSLLSFSNMNILPFSEDIPFEVITYLDPTIEKLWIEKNGAQQLIHLKFYDQDEILLFYSSDLEKYLSAGTIKGIITFSMAKEVLMSGGYLILDDIETHLNKEIVMTLIRFFMDSKLNRNGGVLVFSTHYPEILDEYDRNDQINVVRNKNGITVEILCNILKRNDIKKSNAYQSGMLDGTAPSYEAYLRLKKSLSM